MSDVVGVRQLRQNLSRYLDRVKAGESLEVTERGRVVARLVPAGPSADLYAELAAEFGTSVPVESREAIASRLTPPGARAGTTDRLLADGQADRHH